MLVKIILNQKILFLLNQKIIRILWLYFHKTINDQLIKVYDKIDKSINNNIKNDMNNKINNNIVINNNKNLIYILK